VNGQGSQTATDDVREGVVCGFQGQQGAFSFACSVVCSTLSTCGDFEVRCLFGLGASEVCPFSGKSDLGCELGYASTSVGDLFVVVDRFLFDGPGNSACLLGVYSCAVGSLLGCRTDTGEGCHFVFTTTHFNSDGGVSGVCSCANLRRGVGCIHGSDTGIFRRRHVCSAFGGSGSSVCGPGRISECVESTGGGDVVSADLMVESKYASFGVFCGGSGALDSVVGGLRRVLGLNVAFAFAFAFAFDFEFVGSQGVVDRTRSGLKG
jgi:hypothetical protein